VLGALGVVFGDIGTSPLYTLQECLSGAHGAAPDPTNVLGVVSLILWAVTLVVTVKYLAFLMCAEPLRARGLAATLLPCAPSPSGCPAPLIQQIALENNLPVTASIVGGSDRYRLRWFTPTTKPR
jgi:hypothetical protein